MARRQRLYCTVTSDETVRAVVAGPPGLAAADEVGAGAVARAPIEADLALLEGSCITEDEKS